MQDYQGKQQKRVGHYQHAQGAELTEGKRGHAIETGKDGVDYQKETGY